MKKYAILVLVLVLTAALFTGCGCTNQDPSRNTTVPTTTPTAVSCADQISCQTAPSSSDSHRSLSALPYWFGFSRSTSSIASRMVMRVPSFQRRTSQPAAIASSILCAASSCRLAFSSTS